MNFEAEELELPPEFPAVGPECVKGIEINPFAAELARVSVWIGEIQWMREKNFGVSTNPILKPLETIECRDALLNPDGTEAVWPEADVIIGNPPFLGSQLMIGTLGEVYVRELRASYLEKIEGAVDLVTYWFAKSWEMICLDAKVRVGLVATQAIRRGSSQEVLRRIYNDGRIFNAWDDEPWIVEGASVRVCITCFEKHGDAPVYLDGAEVDEIFPDLSSGIALTTVARLPSNEGICFQGPVKVGAFQIEGDKARNWLTLPLNPNGKRNIEVLRPWANGIDLTRRPSGRWIIDFGELAEAEAALFERPFAHVVEFVKPARLNNRDDQRREKWWRLGRSGAELKDAISKLSRQILTARVAKYRLLFGDTQDYCPILDW